MTDIAPVPIVDSRKGRSPGQSATLFMGKYGALIVLALLVVVFTIMEPKYFLTWGNIVQIFNQSALAAMVVLGAGLGSDPRWRPRRRWLLPAAALTGAALLAFAVLYVAALWGWPGWPQRVLLGAILAWLYLTARRLRALRPAGP